MGVCVLIYIVNSLVVQPVDADFTMGMNDVVVFQDNSYVYDSSIFIIEKCEVTGTAFLNKT